MPTMPDPTSTCPIFDRIKVVTQDPQRVKSALNLLDSTEDFVALGKVLGPAIAKPDIGRAVEQIVDVYIELRTPAESFLQTLDRLGHGPFKERLYATTD